jgi:acetyl esterase/lipase
MLIEALSKLIFVLKLTQYASNIVNIPLKGKKNRAFRSCTAILASSLVQRSGNGPNMNPAFTWPGRNVWCLTGFTGLYEKFDNPVLCCYHISMKKILKAERTDPVVMLASEIVYSQKAEWCNATMRSLALSLMRPRYYFNYDKKYVMPLIVWICGGGFTTMDRNVWTPELAWFVKHGYAVASVDYSVTGRTRFPDAVVEIKTAIRFLKACGKKYGLDTSRIALMGESAGGYLTALCALTGANKEFDSDEYGEYTSEVQAAIPWYPPSRVSEMPPPKNKGMLPHDWEEYADVTKYITPKSPPFLILHGNADSQVPHSQGELLHDCLEKAGAEAELIIIEGAEHADAAFVQEEIKREILSFLKARL